MTYLKAWTRLKNSSTHTLLFLSRIGTRLQSGLQLLHIIKAMCSLKLVKLSNAYTSFLTQTPSDFHLTALTSCSLLYITKSDLEKLYALTTCGDVLGRIFAEKLFLYLSKRENDFMIKSPTQRYLDLFVEQPQLIQEIPQKYLASYIGITPQALSRIRAKTAQ